MKEPMDATLLYDERVKCYSLMTAMTAGEYLKMVESAYANRGGLPFQRDALRTTTAKRIRARMISDIIKGAVLPPVVIGVVVKNATLVEIPTMTPAAIIKLISEQLVDSISIIDGMQRTTGLLHAFEADQQSVSKKEIRIEYWIAESTDSLIYRMLVLNSGQIPWTLSRQLHVVYSPLMDEMKKRVKFERVLNSDKNERRTKAGEYQPDSLIELYIAFGLRKTDIDTQETLADEFSRLDMADALDEGRYNDFFYPILQMMVDLDVAFSRLDSEIDIQEDGATDQDASPDRQTLKKGKSIFDRKPARIGFIVAAAVAILGRIGMERKQEDSTKTLTEVKYGLNTLIEKLNKMNTAELSDFLKLDVLSEILYSQKRSQFGRYERAFYETAFKVLIDEKFRVPNMEPLWRA